MSHATDCRPGGTSKAARSSGSPMLARTTAPNRGCSSRHSPNIHVEKRYHTMLNTIPEVMVSGTKHIEGYCSQWCLPGQSCCYPGIIFVTNFVNPARQNTLLLLQNLKPTFCLFWGPHQIGFRFTTYRTEPCLWCQVFIFFKKSVFWQSTDFPCLKICASALHGGMARSPFYLSWQSCFNKSCEYFHLLLQD